MKAKTKTTIFTAALVACFFGICIASPVRSNLGGDSIDDGDTHDYTAADYVQDGLIALWDGIENVDWGQHDGTSLSWVDLTGNHSSYRIASTMHWEADSIVGNSENLSIPMTFLSQKYPHSNGPVSIEQVGECEEGFSRIGFGIVQFRSQGDSEASVPVGALLSVPSTSRNFDSYGIGMQFYYPWPSGLTFERRSLSGIVNYTMTSDGESFDIYKEGLPMYAGKKCGTWSWTKTTIHLLWQMNSTVKIGTTRVYCVRIYDRKLSQEEVRYNNLIDRLRFNLP